MYSLWDREKVMKTISEQSLPNWVSTFQKGLLSDSFNVSFFGYLVVSYCVLR
jgi:hypothetical protein